MRLQVLEHGQPLRVKTFFAVTGLLSRVPPDPVTQIATYRPDFFGASLLDMAHEVMRGPSFWTAAEREWLAAYVSRRNECPFCAKAHGETTRVESSGSMNPSDPDAVRPELRATLPLLDRLDTDGDLTRADLDAVRAAGVPDDAIADVFAVGLFFDCINRVANALDFTWVSDRHARLSARVIHLVKYHMPGFLLR